MSFYGAIRANTLSDTVTGTVDVAFVELVTDLTNQVRDLSAAAAMWQTRAAHLDDQLKQLTAGGNDAHEAPESPESVDHSTQGPSVEDAGQDRATGILERLRRWLHGSG